MTSLISIDHLSQVLPALASLRHNRLSLSPIVVLTKPHLHFSDQQKQLLTTLFSIEPNVTIIIGHELVKRAKLVTYIPVRLRAMLLGKKLKEYNVNEIYFAHDNSSDFWNQTLMHVFPKAQRNCYGDALGLVYSQAFFNQLMYPLIKNNKILYHNVLARFKRAFLYPNKKHQLLAHQAILAIPCDPGEDFFAKCRLSRVNQDTIRNCVHELANTLTEFKSYMYDLLSGINENCFLLILSNLTESKLTTLDNEIKLYEEILATHTDPSSLIILKPHPAHNDAYFEQIITALKKKYLIKIIDKKFYHLPIELADYIVQACTVLSLSYSSISLNYIYDKKIIHVLTNSLIKKYFLIEKLNWFMENNTLYLEMITSMFNGIAEKELLMNNIPVEIKDSSNE